MRGLFENSPVSLWEEDYSQIKAFFDELRQAGVEDLRDYLDEHPEAVGHCLRMIRVLDVNQKTLSLFGAANRQELIDHLDRIFRDEMQRYFRDQLLHLWRADLTHEAEGINYTLAGDPLHVHVHLSVYPGYEQTLGRVLVALQDVTARHRAEEYLRYLGTHDVLTGLYNRAFFQEELQRMSDGRWCPVTVVMADLNNLKVVNDTLGHVAGDNYIRRAAEILKTGFGSDAIVARVGGDEFAALLPHTSAQEIVERIHTLTRLNNRFYGEPLLSLSVGVCTSEEAGNLEPVMHKADDDMYRNKKEYHRLASSRR